MKNFKNAYYLLNLLWNHKKTTYLCFCSTIILNVALNSIGIVAVNYLIRFLSGEKFESAFICASILCLSTFILNSLVAYNEFKKRGYLDSFNIFIKCMLTDSALSVNFENFEKCDYREKYQFALKCVTNGNVENIVNSCCDFVTYILSFITLSSIISYIAWWLWIVIFLSVTVNVICELYRANINFESEKIQNTVEMKMLYSRDRLTWKPFAKEVRLFNMFSYVSKQAKKYIDLLSHIQNMRAKKTFKALWWSYMFNSILMLAVYIYVSYKCFTGVFSLSHFSVLILSMLSINQMASGMAGSILSIKENNLYTSAFIEFIYISKNKENNYKKPKNKFKNISFDNVCFKYDGAKDFALKNITLSLDIGKKYGIVGKNGSGKTTFVNLLMGLYTPTNGSIKIDGKNINNIDLNEYMNYFSPIFQNYNMYAYSVNENISMMSNADTSRVCDLIDEVNLSGFNGMTNEELANKFISKEYSENGIEFSGGQEQKIAIARALYKNAPIFILDEPSSALSPKSEIELYELVNKRLKNKTTFFVSHRMASCIICDEILVFDDGKIIERGSHSDLMRQEGLYNKMFTLQRQLFSEENL